MRTCVLASLTVLMLVCGANANARGWRDLRIDASSDSRFNDSVQQMRDELPHNRAVLFVLTLNDLKARLAPAEYRERLNGLTYKEIVQLGSPSVSNEYLAYFTALRNKSGSASASGTFPPGSSENGFSGVANPFGAFPGFDQTTGRQLPAP